MQIHLTLTINLQNLLHPFQFLQLSGLFAYLLKCRKLSIIAKVFGRNFYAKPKLLLKIYENLYLTWTISLNTCISHFSFCISQGYATKYLTVENCLLLLEFRTKYYPANMWKSISYLEFLDEICMISLITMKNMC